VKHKPLWICIVLLWLAGCARPTPETIQVTVLLTEAPLPTYTPYPTWTPQRPLPTYTPEPTYTPYPTYTQRPYATSTPWPTHTPAPTETPTPTFTTQVETIRPPAATPTPTPNLVPAPVLLEPESGARFANAVRFKWYWYRRLESMVSPEPFEWWVTEEGLLNSGGAIHPMAAQTIVSGGVAYPVPDGYRFEINGGLGPIPPGQALWSIMVVGETPERKWQISERSEERLIVKVP
jgi:hypothetical protein